MTCRTREKATSLSELEGAWREWLAVLGEASHQSPRLVIDGDRQDDVIDSFPKV